ncbi:MAG: WbqC family protein [Bacteroidetes bacterium]|nr:WbqC family protein [Bacteroidota bacterium]MDA0875613.1 WbqC family protein [Bacteroidota bacterium]
MAPVFHVVPEYFPRPEVLGPLIGASQVVIVTDAQYSRQSWHNRTRVRNPQGWQWLTVPVENGQFGRKIAETRIAYHDGWMTRHEKALQYNYSTSPFYLHYADDISSLLRSRPATLGQLTTATLELMLRWLGRREVVVPPGMITPDLQGASPAPLGTAPAPYRQNYPGFIPGLSTLDILFNLGPHATLDLLRS